MELSFEYQKLTHIYHIKNQNFYFCFTIIYIHNKIGKEKIFLQTFSVTFKMWNKNRFRINQKKKKKKIWKIIVSRQKCGQFHIKPIKQWLTVNSSIYQRKQQQYQFLLFYPISIFPSFFLSYFISMYTSIVNK